MQGINKSLSTLSAVLEARANNEKPRYRDSKLTRFLQVGVGHARQLACRLCTRKGRHTRYLSVQ